MFFACASAATAFTSTTVPSTFDMWVVAISLVRGVIARSKSSMLIEPSSATGTKTSLAPWRSRMKCHGTMLEWCSMIVSTISSPSPISCMP
jgi:hypothetical protein